MSIQLYKSAWDSLTVPTTTTTTTTTTSTSSSAGKATALSAPPDSTANSGVVSAKQATGSSLPSPGSLTKGVADGSTKADNPPPNQTENGASPEGDQPDDEELAHSSMRRIMDIVEMEGKNGLTVTSKAQAFRKPKTKKNQFDDYSGVVRRSLDQRGNVISVTLEIRSPFLRNFLKTVLKGFKDVNLDADLIVLPKMYKPLFYKYNEIRDKAMAAERGPAQEELMVLFDFMTANLEETLKIVARDVEKRRIASSLVWTLFPPGELVYLAPKPNRSAQVLLAHSCNQGVANGMIFLELKCSVWSYDGRCFGERSLRLCQIIEPTSGSFQITDLDFYPLKYHPNEVAERKKLIERGRNYVKWVQRQHMSYKGVVRTVDPIDDEVIQIHVNSRVMVDYALYVRNQPNAAVSLEGDLDPDTLDQGAPCFCGMPNCPIDSRKKKEEDDKLKAAEKIKGTSATEEKSDMTDEQVLRCPAVVGGFSLQDKVWAEFRVDRLEKVIWNPDAYTKLEMDPMLKTVIEALVAGHRQHSPNKEDTPDFDDVIAGKGLGLSFLLQGPPGLGKTLTAESVAEQSKKPLYSVTSGELGTTVRDMETNLRKAFSIAKEWNAILLLDEADVFMSKRSADNLEKNAFVSVFLRLIEYYQGIMFLTTNRAEDFDDAFMSRIHLIIDYEPLDLARRKKIWQNLAGNISNKDVSSLNDEGFDRLAEYKINGREIKNILRTAWSLAKQKGEPLNLKHVELVAGLGSRKYQNT